MTIVFPMIVHIVIVKRTIPVRIKINMDDWEIRTDSVVFVTPIINRKRRREEDASKNNCYIALFLLVDQNNDVDRRSKKKDRRRITEFNKDKENMISINEYRICRFSRY